MNADLADIRGLREKEREQEGTERTEIDIDKHQDVCRSLTALCFLQFILICVNPFHPRSSACYFF
jgi:hypothetical protein